METSDKNSKIFRVISNLRNDLEYVINAHFEGKKIILFCAVIDESDGSCDRLYYVSDKIDGARVLGEIELFRKDILDNLVSGDFDIDLYEEI